MRRGLAAIALLALTLYAGRAEADAKLPGTACTTGSGNFNADNGIMSCVSGVYTLNNIWSAGAAIGTAYAGLTSPPTGGAIIQGNVGIGTNAAASPLTVAGLIQSTTGGVQFPDGTTQTTAASAIPSGLIAAFATTSCPSGWTEYTAARGRFLRGIDNGAGNDPDGTRSPGSAQADMVGPHTHNLGHSYLPDGSNAAWVVNYQGNIAGDIESVNPNSGTETRPKNVAVTFCQKS